MQLFVKFLEKKIIRLRPRSIDAILKQDFQDDRIFRMESFAAARKGKGSRSGTIDIKDLTDLKRRFITIKPSS